jgi:hypothetical protein
MNELVHLVKVKPEKRAASVAEISWKAAELRENEAERTEDGEGRAAAFA